MLRKFLFLFFAIVAIAVNAQSVVVYRRTTPSVYVVEQPVRTQVVYTETPARTETRVVERVEEPQEQKLLIKTRFGYAFENYFTYGASIGYKFNNDFGISAGYDGYASNYKEWKTQSAWDVRLGIMLGKYVEFGGIIGKCNICKDPNYEHKGVCTFTKNANNFGGYIGLIFPIHKYFGIDIDAAYTTHTSFNIAAGIFIQIPFKQKH